MLGSEMLEVAIGIIFVFLLISIICSAVREGIEAWLKTRAAYLEYAIRELLHDRQGMGLAHSFYNHPLIFSLYSGEYPGALSWERPTGFTRGGRLPSYIPSRNFALAVMDLAARGPDPDAVTLDPGRAPISLAAMRANALSIQNAAIQRMLLAAIDGAQGDLQRFHSILEQWYDSAMDRVSGMYRRSTQWIIFGIALFVAVALNVNTIALTDFLYHNDAARDVVVARAEAAAADTSFIDRDYASARADLEALRLPIGWSRVDFGWPGSTRSLVRSVDGVTTERVVTRGWWDYVFSPLFGWLITALAATLGAPFWFDVLNKFMVVRSTVKPHEKSPEEASEDRRLPTRGSSDEGSEARAGTAAEPGSRPADGAVVAYPIGSAAAVVGAGDPESAVDGCDVDIDRATPDEELPPAEGGVA